MRKKEIIEEKGHGSIGKKKKKVKNSLTNISQIFPVKMNS